MLVELGKLREGAAASELGDFDAQLQKIKDSATAFLGEIANAGVLEYFQGRIAALTQRIRELAASGDLKRWAQSVSDGITSVGRSIESGIGFVTKYSAELIQLGKVYLAFKFASFLLGMAASAKAMYDAGTAAKTAAAKRAPAKNAPAKTKPVKQAVVRTVPAKRAAAKKTSVRKTAAPVPKATHTARASAPTAKRASR